MSAVRLEQKAMRMLETLERAGKSVTRVTLEGKRIEFELGAVKDAEDEFEGIDLRHDQA